MGSLAHWNGASLAPDFPPRLWQADTTSAAKLNLAMLCDGTGCWHTASSGPVLTQPLSIPADTLVVPTSILQTSIQAHISFEAALSFHPHLMRGSKPTFASSLPTKKLCLHAPWRKLNDPLKGLTAMGTTWPRHHRAHLAALASCRLSKRHLSPSLLCAAAK